MGWDRASCPQAPLRHWHVCGYDLSSLQDTGPSQANLRGRGDSLGFKATGILSVTEDQSQGFLEGRGPGGKVT